MDLPDEEITMQNPKIWSKTISVGPNSFADCKQPFNKLAPPPIYYTGEQLLEAFKLPVDKDEILFGFETPEDAGGLICTDDAMLDKQKGVLTHVVR